MTQQISSAPLQPDKAEFQDCTPCRIIGSATFLGLGAFTYVTGHSQIRANEAAIRASKPIFGMRSRRAAISGMSTVMLGLGVYRWFR
ncbi:hypothetical protein BDW02DRAFT_500636 [Decorospora gaudefroyi]|uniref:Distal membrane-arm assembly complex protein 1-like domain-containing protein n=1 Tax=Decorospora gaudefroyi TaxID=184978 RepID=A0A6A5KA87_9PLEO|nr:hypothetical protein BDW02DRAFT_500636 [Decorospora gaudefroyi]